jgi:hypothetical protein
VVLLIRLLGDGELAERLALPDMLAIIPDVSFSLSLA